MRIWLIKNISSKIFPISLYSPTADILKSLRRVSRVRHSAVFAVNAEIYFFKLFAQQPNLSKTFLNNSAANHIIAFIKYSALSGCNAFYIFIKAHTNAAIAIE